jgi:hypothetical protein
VHSSGENKNEVLRPDFDRSIMMDFQGAKLSSVFLETLKG